MVRNKKFRWKVYTFERITGISYGVALFIKMWQILIKHILYFLCRSMKNINSIANKSKIPMQSTPAGCVSHWPDEVHPLCSQFWMLSSSPSQFIPDSNTGTWVGPVRLPLVIAVAYKMRFDIETKNMMKQESIPAGCVPAARWPYPVVCFPGGGVCLLRGVSAPRGVSGPGGCLVLGGVWSQGVSAPGGVCSRGVSAGGFWSGGSGPRGSAPGGLLLEGVGAGIPACTEADPPVDRITDACKTLPWPNFIAAGNKESIPARCVPLTCQLLLFWWHPLGVSTGGGVSIWRGQWGYDTCPPILTPLGYLPLGN